MIDTLHLIFAPNLHFLRIVYSSWEIYFPTVSKSLGNIRCWLPIVNEIQTLVPIPKSRVPKMISFVNPILINNFIIICFFKILKFIQNKKLLLTLEH
jgi:hypothetical protein